MCIGLCRLGSDRRLGLRPICYTTMPIKILDIVKEHLHRRNVQSRKMTSEEFDVNQNPETAKASSNALLRRPTVAIIGGGFSGSMLAVELVRRAAAKISVVLIERRPVPGRGVAYGTQFEGHLLNVRAKNMSAYADAPDHFVRWAQRHYSHSVKPNDFLPRPVYGQYISSQIQAAASLHHGGLRCIQEEAVSLTRAGARTLIHMARGKPVGADTVVLALGNFPPADLHIPGKAPDSARYISNPWFANVPKDAAHGGSVLLIGSGLTSVDVTLELRAQGFEGTIHVLSRRGLLPQRHAAVPSPPFPMENAPRTVRGLLRLIRVQVRKAEERGSNWRAVVDSLRPVTQQIWCSLAVVEQRRFLRHLQTYWDVHRHRIADRVADQLTLQLRSGQMQMHSGRIIGYREGPGDVNIIYRDRKSGESRTVCVDRVINCTGPEGDCRRVESPLLLGLMEKKLARPNALGLGLDVTYDGSVIDAKGSASNSLYALGPLCKGKLWESVAVPELRIQIADLAHLLINHFGAETGFSLAVDNKALATIHS